MNNTWKKFDALYGSRKNNFNFLRLFFALMVIVSHSSSLIYGKGTPEPLSNWTHGQIDLGSLAVNAFFVISGFLLVGSWENSPGVLNFFGRRVLRIYPGLIVCMAVCVFIVGPLGGADLHTYFTNPKTYKLFEYAFMRNFWNSVPGAFSSNPLVEINSPLWTIKYEIICYVCLAVLGLMKLTRPVPLLIIFLLIFTYNCALVEHGGRSFFNTDSIPNVGKDFIEGTIPRFLTFFLAGSVYYAWRDKVPHSGILFVACLVLIIASCFHYLQVTLPLFGGYVLLHLGLNPRIHLGWFDKVDLSYGVYLYAWPIQQLFVYYHFPGSTVPILLTLLTLLPVFFIASLSWFYVEKPCLAFKRKRLKTAKPQGDAINP